MRWLSQPRATDGFVVFIPMRCKCTRRRVHRDDPALVLALLGRHQNEPGQNHAREGERKAKDCCNDSNHVESIPLECCRWLSLNERAQALCASGAFSTSSWRLSAIARITT